MGNESGNNQKTVNREHQEEEDGEVQEKKMKKGRLFALAEKGIFSVRNADTLTELKLDERINKLTSELQSELKVMKAGEEKLQSEMSEMKSEISEIKSEISEMKSVIV